ncbi:MAG TPA: hypothetical protein VF589_06520 [Allosphingosinicella sp.]|jgi:Gpi18-like mannosyltransferase
MGAYQSISEAPAAAEGARAAPEGLRIGLIALAAACVYAAVWPAVTGDMNDYLVPWYDTILARGRVGAFAEPFGNYTPPYLYLLSAVSLFDGLLAKVTLIKLLSVAGVAALAWAVARLVGAAGVERPWRAALWVFLLPSVVLNAPAMGQCDAIWAAACIAAVAETVERRPAAMLVWCGVAIAFKAQAVFIAPFIISRLLAERTPWHLWAIPPLVYGAAMLPAWLMGWPAADLATIYLRQTEWGPDFLGNAPNPWAWAQHFFAEAGAGYRWVGHAAAAAAALAYVVVFGRRRLGARGLVAAALLAAIMLPWLLPKMHERFFFLADLLAFALAAIRRDRIGVAVAVLVQAGSVLALGGLLAASSWPAMVGSVAMLAAAGLTLRCMRGEDAGPEAGQAAERLAI